MFSGDAFVLTVKTNLTAGLMSDPLQLVGFFEAVNAVTHSAFEKHEPLRIQAVSDVFQAVFDYRTKNLIELLNTVRELPAAINKRVPTQACPISCGIACGPVVFDDQLLIGDALVQSATFAEEAARRNALLLIEAKLLPDIYGAYETMGLKGKSVALLREKNFV